MNTNCIILFVKYPRKNIIKTRLTKTMNANNVIDLYKCFVLDIIETLKSTDEKIIICYDPPESGNKYKKWLGKEFIFLKQRGNDLGNKMHHAFIDAFNLGYEKAVLLGSDLPDIPLELLKNSFKSLDENQAVIGPSFDGGYYLIGFKKNNLLKDVFYDIPWSTSTVLKNTEKIFSKNNYKVCFLGKMRDIDEIEDLHDLIERSKNHDFSTSNTMKLIKELKIDAQ